MADEGCLEVQRNDGSVLCIGDRVESDGFMATVRYIGAVTPTKGIWIGVEWDDPSRGKHDGVHEGHRYFSTSHPTSASFLRPAKTNLGISVMAAINDRYGLIDDVNAGVITEDLYVVGAGNQQTIVEMVGAKKVNELQSKLHELKEVVLRGLMVYGTKLSHDLRSMVPSIRDLDISANLVPSWDMVAEITKQLPKLKSLNVSENKLEFPESGADLSPHFSHITVLYLNRMDYTWEQILQTSHMFSSLEKLHLCFNNIQTISNISSHFPRLEKLKLINFESNKLESWSEVLKIGHLPQLEEIILSDNKLSSISFDETPPTGTTQYFPKLKSMTINHNNISEWSSINELNKLQCLEDIRMKNTPLSKSCTEETFRQLLISKLKHLKVCNRTKVSQQERKESERDYLKRYGLDWVKAGGSQDPSKNKPSEQFIKEHPRYLELIGEWGPPEDSEMQKVTNSLKNNLISVKIHCPSLPEKEDIEKKLPGTMTVQKVKALINRLYKLNSEINLTYISQKMDGQEVELDNDQRFLSYYSIEPGDVIQVKI